MNFFRVSIAFRPKKRYNIIKCNVIVRECLHTHAQRYPEFI